MSLKKPEGDDTEHLKINMNFQTESWYLRQAAQKTATILHAQQGAEGAAPVLTCADASAGDVLIWIPTTIVEAEVDDDMKNVNTAMYLFNKHKSSLEHYGFFRWGCRSNVTILLRLGDASILVIYGVRRRTLLPKNNFWYLISERRGFASKCFERRLAKN